MKKTNSKKLDLYIYIIVLICVFIMFVGMFLTYYVKTNKNNDKVVKHNSVLMSLTYDGKDQININNIKPGWEDKLNFSISNYSNDSISKYKIVLEIITPLSNMIDEDFLYTIEGVSDSKDNTNMTINNSNTPIPVITKELNGGVITPNSTHNYTISFKLNKKASEKKYKDNSLFSAKIKVMDDN